MNNTQSNQRFAFIDGLRGIAALWVVVMHFQTLILERTTHSFPSWLEAIFKQGHMGVKIFFVLSGFVIAYSIRNQEITFSFVRNFFIRRSIRLDPPYWITLMLLTSLILAGPILFNKGHEYVPSSSEFLLNAFYLQNFAEVKNILPVAWTLCLEFQFYLIFVFCLQFVQYLNKKTNNSLFNYSKSAGTLFFVSFFLISLCVAADLLPNIPGLFLPFWYSFFIGCVLCWGLVNYISDGRIIFLLVLMGLFSFFNLDILITLAISLIIYSSVKLGKMDSFLNFPVFQFFGKISYSIYLLHWPVGIKFISLLAFLMGNSINLISPYVLMLISVSICVFASALFFKYVEEPFIRLSKNIGTRYLELRKKFGHP